MKLKLIALVALLAPSVQAATVFYAGSAASGSGDGSSWANRMAWADALAAAVAVEPSPNGRRVNLGAYGNTPWASLTPTHGFILFVR